MVTTLPSSSETVTDENGSTITTTPETVTDEDGNVVTDENGNNVTPTTTASTTTTTTTTTVCSPEPRKVISMTIRDETTFEPVAGAVVNISSTERSMTYLFASHYTNIDGKIEEFGSDNGIYSVSVTAAGYISQDEDIIVDCANIDCEDCVASFTLDLTPISSINNTDTTTTTTPEPVTDEEGNTVTDEYGSTVTTTPEAVTDNEGNVVTDESGNNVTVTTTTTPEPVTDEEGNVVTDEYGSTVTTTPEAVTDDE